MVMAVDSMLRRAGGAQAGIQPLHDQAPVGAACPAAGFAKGEAFACNGLNKQAPIPLGISPLPERQKEPRHPNEDAR
jgi:hypothetical protein